MYFGVFDADGVSSLSSTGSRHSSHPESPLSLTLPLLASLYTHANIAWPYTMVHGVRGGYYTTSVTKRVT